MKKTMKQSVTMNRRRRRDDERGAALILMLLIAMLLLAAGGALITSTALSTTSIYESTPEAQAYYAAEAGLEDVLTVLRGNVAPLSVASGATGGGSSSGGSGEIPDSQKISLRRAITHETSDHADDPVSAPKLRLSRWLNYNYTPPNGDYPDRVTLVDNYSPFSGTAYRVTLSDPDKSTTVNLTTTGLFKAPPGVTVSPDGLSLIVNNALGAAVGTARITYVPRPITAPINTSASPTTSLGTFNVTSTGIGATLPPGITFNLSVNQSVPWQATTPLTATLSGAVNPIALLSTLQVGFLRDSLSLNGTVITITNLLGNVLSLLVPPVGGTRSVPIEASIAPPEPRRVLIVSTGLGPRGAMKRIEMLVRRNTLDFDAPATITIRGATDCSPMNFATGNSNAKDYKGADLNASDPARPAFAINGCDYDDGVNGTGKPETVTGSTQFGILDSGSAPNAPMTSSPVGTPGFLENADKARQYLNELEGTARTQGRYFKPASGSMSYNGGTTATPAFTFIDGDCDLSGGVGLLVVTGALNMSGNASFDGVILVLGAGSMNRNGGGGGDINGSVVVARFERTWPPEENSQAHPFLAPTFNTNGGGNSTVQYSSAAVARALRLFSVPVVSGVAEL